jgi:alanyl aminopeptidase
LTSRSDPVFGAIDVPRFIGEALNMRSPTAAFTLAKITRMLRVSRCPIVTGLLFVISTTANIAAETFAPPRFRLGTDARPLGCALDLVIVPEHSNFTGHAMIELKLERRTSILWLHATNLNLEHAYAEAKGVKISIRVETNANQYVGFGFERPVGPGRARLHIAYHGRMYDQQVGGGSFLEGNGGLLRRQQGGDWYASTFLAWTCARRVFPCFDEPSFKIPWQVTLHVKREHLALANAPAISEIDEPGGMKCVRFAQTQPLPSYLVAFAVGPFDVVSLGKVGRKGTPVRIITPRGRTGEAAFAAQCVPAWFRMVEDYCGVPFPYDKLDHVTVPWQPAHGMENAGLITYSDEVQLAPQETADFQGFCADVSAHELTHQWFGDLVGIPWWDEAWFKEAFALFIGRKILHQWRPVQHKSPVEVSTRWFPIDGRLGRTNGLRQPIKTETDIFNALDSASVNQVMGMLTMFEGWLGERTFQKSVQRFLQQYAGRTATLVDFAKIMSAVSRQDLVPAFSTFLDQPGVPLVKIDLKDGAKGQSILVLAQERYRAVGSARLPECTWRIPIRLRYEAGGKEKRLSVLLNGPHMEVALDSAPKWVLVNEGATGFYRVGYPRFLLHRLLYEHREHLSATERLGLVEDLRASIISGQLLLGEALALLPELLKDSEPLVVTEAAKILESSRDLVPEPLRINYQRFVRTAITPNLHGARWQASSSESDASRQLRLARLGLMANQGEEQSLIDDARRQAVAWLADRTSLEGDAVPVVLGVAGRYGDHALLEQFISEAKKTTNTTDHSQLFTAIGSCRDPGLLNSLLLALAAKEYPPGDAYDLLEAACYQPENHHLIYEFVKQHFDAVMAALPEDERSWSLTMIVQGFSDAEHRADVARFLKGKDSIISGGALAVAQLLEGIDLACAFRSFHHQNVENYLKTQ